MVCLFSIVWVLKTKPKQKIHNLCVISTSQKKDKHQSFYLFPKSNKGGFSSKEIKTNETLFLTTKPFHSIYSLQKIRFEFPIQAS